MADRYWVGGTGTWNTTSTTNWSATPGGASGASVPTAADSVFFDQSGTYTVTMTNALTCLDITVSAGLVTFSRGTTPTLNIAGSMSLIAGTVWISNGTITFSSTTTGKTITTNGVTIGGSTGSIIFNGAGGAWTLGSALTVDSTATVTLTAGTLNLSTFTLTTGLFNSSGTSARTIAFGTGNITVNGAGGTLWTTSITTGLTTTGTQVVNVSYSGALATTIASGSLSEANSISFNFTTGTYSLTHNTGSKRNLNFTGFAGSVSNTAQTIYGNLNLGSTATFTAGASSWTFASTSAGKTITTNGRTIQFPIIFNGVGGVWTLQDAMTLSPTRGVTHSSGTLALATYTLTAGSFSSSTATTRVIAFGTGNITVNGSSGSLVSIGNTNLTTTGTQVINVSNTGAGASNITPGSLNQTNAISYNITTGSYALTWFGGTFRDLNFTGFSGTVNNTTQIIYGNINLGSTATLTGGTSAWTLAGTSIGKTITSNGKTMDFPLNFNGIGGTWVLQDALTQGSTRQLLHTNGTIDLNGKTLTAGSEYGIATGTKNITFNGGTLVCTGTSLAFNNVIPAGFTTTAGTGTGTISMTAATAKLFRGNGSTFNCTINQGGAGALTISEGGTFNNITNTVQPASILFTAGTTNTFNNFNLSGTAGNLITIASVTAGSQATLSDASGTISVSYCAIKDINATGGATWNSYTTNGCVDNGNNTGWIFISGLAGITIPQGLFIGNGVTFSPVNYNPLLTLSQSGSVSSLLYTTTMPSSGIAAGDVAVILAQYRIDAATADYTPAGWTQIGTALQPSGSSLVRINSYYKILTAGDIGASVQTSPVVSDGSLTWSGSQTWIWTPSSPVTAVTVNNLNGSGSASAIAYTITTNGVSGPLIALGQAAAQTAVAGQWLSWTGLSATQTFSRDSVTSGDPARGAYTLVNGGSTAGADITASVTDIGIQELQTFYLTFSA